MPCPQALPYDRRSVVAEVFGSAGLDLAELGLELLHVVGEGEHELFSVFGAHDDAAYDGCLGHAGSVEDEVDEELCGAVADHGEIAVLAVSDLRTQLDLQLVLVFVLVCHFAEYKLFGLFILNLHILLAPPFPELYPVAADSRSTKTSAKIRKFLLRTKYKPSKTWMN